MQYQKADSSSIPVKVFSALKTRLFNLIISYNSNSPHDQSVITSLPFDLFKKSQTFHPNQQPALRTFLDLRSFSVGGSAGGSTT